jgi:uncharacterized protein YjiS (DUF1127 family)
MLSPSMRTSHATLAGLTARSRPWRAGGLVGVVDLLLAWHERGRQRRHLRAFDDHMLRDIGLSRADVEAEADKPFWQP